MKHPGIAPVFLIFTTVVVLAAALYYFGLARIAHAPAVPTATSTVPFSAAGPASGSSPWRALHLGQAIYGSTEPGVGYVRDSSGVHTTGEGAKDGTVAGADPATFEVNTDWPIYARDAKQVYVFDKAIPGADPATFVALCGIGGSYEVDCGYGKDAAHVYAYTRVIPEADAATFVSLVSNNPTNRKHAGKSWTYSAIDAHALYQNYYDGPAAGLRGAALADGTPLHFTDTAKVIAVNLDDSSWGGYYEGIRFGDKAYYRGWYLVDGTNVYTIYGACNLDASGKEVAGSCVPKISRVEKVGGRPAGI